MFCPLPRPSPSMMAHVLSLLLLHPALTAWTPLLQLPRITAPQNSRRYLPLSNTTLSCSIPLPGLYPTLIPPPLSLDFPVLRPRTSSSRHSFLRRLPYSYFRGCVTVLPHPFLISPYSASRFLASLPYSYRSLLAVFKPGLISCPSPVFCTNLSSV